MLRSSEIKPLFVDLSEFWQVIFFFLSIVPSGCVCEWTTNFFYHLPHVECVCVFWFGCVCVLGRWVRIRMNVVPYASAYESMVAYAYQFNGRVCNHTSVVFYEPFLWWVRIRMNVVPNTSAYESMGAYMDDLWVRIWMTCGCVWNHTSVVSYDPFLWWVRIRMNVVPHASAYESMGAYMDDLWVRIWMTCGCV